MFDKIQKIWKLLIVFLFFISLGFTFTKNKRADKVALIIAIADYPTQPEGHGWADIAADRDVHYLKTTLAKQGFKKNNIIVLKNEKATKENILKVLQQTLPRKIKPGGMCFIHFSTHGQQIFDQNGDEPDLLDEAIITYDAQRKFVPGKYEGEAHLRDEEITAALLPLRKIIGPDGQVLVNLDACHSGSGLRDKTSITARGSKDIFAPPGFDYQSQNVDIGTGFDLMNDQPLLAPLIGLYASGPAELNYQMLDEGQQVGSLTYAFCLAFSEATPQMTYRMLFDRIRQVMYRKAPRQTPQVEGAIDQFVFGGQIKGAANYFRIDRKLSNNKIKINQGVFQGLAEGAVIGLFENEVHHPKESIPILTGKVISADLGSSVVRLDQELNPTSTEVDLFKVFILEKSYINPLEIKIDNNLPQSYKNYFQQKMTDHAAFLESDDGAVLLTVASKDLEVIHSDGTVLFRSLDKEAVWSFLFKYYVADFMRNISSQRQHLKADLNLILIDSTINTRDTKILIKSGISDTIYLQGQQFNCVLSPGMTYRFQLINNTMSELYYTVVEVDPDHNTKLVVPACDSSGRCWYKNDLKINPGMTHVYGISFEVPPITGTHVLKLITSTQPIQIEEVLRTRSSAQPSFDRNNPLNHLLELIASEQVTDLEKLTRSKKELLIPTRNIHIETFLYDTVEK